MSIFDIIPFTYIQRYKPCREKMNVTSESYCSRPNVSTLQSSVFIRGDHIVATRSYFNATLVCKDFMNVTSESCCSRPNVSTLQSSVLIAGDHIVATLPYFKVELWPNFFLVKRIFAMSGVPPKFFLSFGLLLIVLWGSKLGSFVFHERSSKDRKPALLWRR